MAEHEAHHDHSHHPEDPRAHATRRAVLQAAIGVGMGTTVLSTLFVGVGLVPKKEITPEKEPIAAGDLLVFGQGDKKGQPITVTDLQQGALQITAYPMDPKTQVVKDKEANNTVLVMRLDPSTLSPDTARNAADGIVAYSGVCKHLGCIVSQWEAAGAQLVCPCHQGKYDPKDGGKVTAGPPPGPIPQLPIRIEGNQVVVAAGFVAEPGKA